MIYYVFEYIQNCIAFLYLCTVIKLSKSPKTYKHTIDRIDGIKEIFDIWENTQLTFQCHVNIIQGVYIWFNG